MKSNRKAPILVGAISLGAWLLVWLSASAQREGVNWYFGRFAGINFLSGVPVNLPQGPMNAPEGCSSVSDRQGNLRFYSNGRTVWNRQGRQMLNGGALMGDSTASQSVLAVPTPGNPNRYYLFTTQGFGQGGLYYHIIDMAGDNGLGAVAVKNQLLHTPTAEKITAVSHANGTDYWIITHEWSSDRYLAWQLTPTGLSPTPVISAVGPVHQFPNSNAKGYMKASADGTKLALAINFSYLVVLTDFDNATGGVSNARTATFGNGFPYGVEFSPNSQLLYVSTTEFVAGGARVNNLHQLDASTTTQQALRNSRIVVGTYSESGIFAPENPLGAIQVAPDGRVYIARVNDFYLSGVLNPDVRGVGCDFRQLAYGPLSGVCGWGIPTLVASFFLPPVVDLAFVDRRCVGQPIAFRGLTSSTNPQVAWRWKFNDSLNAPNDTSTQRNPTYTFRTPGIHPVWVYLTENGLTDSSVKFITIFANPRDPLGPDRVLCQGDTAVLDAGNPGFSYLWSTTQSQRTIRVTTPGNYTLRVSNGLCDSTFSIRISYVTPPVLTLPDDATFCDSTEYTIRPTVDFPVPWPAGVTPLFLWEDGFVGRERTVTQSGLYRLRVGTLNCYVEDSVPVWFRGGNKPELGPDTLICTDDGEVYRLSVPGFLLYRWSYTGEADINLRSEFGPTIYARALGRYTVETMDSTGCLARDSVTLRDGCQRKRLPNAFSPNADGLNDRFTTRLTNLLDMQLSIFDRWGRMVFQTRNSDEHWDGTHNAKPCPEGVYVWYLNYRRSAAEPLRQESGTVTLIR